METIIDRSLRFNQEDVFPLLEYLKMEKKEVFQAKKRKRAAMIADHLLRMGSNDIATFFRGGKGVEYDEVVLDVGEKLDAKVSEDASVARNEEAILRKVFEDALDQMSDQERRDLLGNIKIKGGDVPYGATGAAIVRFLLGQGGFSVYRMSVIVANMVARALLGRGLSFAANAALTRTIGVFMGPVGWIATGAWLAIELAGPAFRKTVPAVIHVALLRQMLMNRVTIGVVGDGATGKDALIKAVFGIDTGQIDPVAGSTTAAQVYELGDEGRIQIINYPGFNDYRAKVNERTDDLLHHTDVFVMVVDLSRGVSGTDKGILQRLKGLYGDEARPILVCLNKWDLVREAHRAKLEETARERLGASTSFERTVLDPDDRLWKEGPLGVDNVRAWLTSQVRAAGKDVSDSWLQDD